MNRSSMTLGTSADGEVMIDLPKLLETRMLVQSNSGGGKSWALRRLLEQTAPAAQQIIVDVEGEFTTLREKFDYMICAPQGGDAAATPQTAPVLARKLRELRVSAIIDIHDLKADERQPVHQNARPFAQGALGPAGAGGDPPRGRGRSRYGRRAARRERRAETEAIRPGEGAGRHPGNGSKGARRQSGRRERAETPEDIAGDHDTCRHGRACGGDLSDAAPITYARC